MSTKISLILGGARSGKSTFAEQIALNATQPVTYIATAEAKDPEMQKRVEIHKKRRPTEWNTWEGNPNELPEAIKNMSGILLMDCLTMWLTRLFLADEKAENAPETEWFARETEILTLTEKLCNSVQNDTHLLIVSNEVGFGLVPPYKMGRRFRDMQGRANQLCAKKADEVVLVVAGYPMYVKTIK
ncbi:MAG: bifunctional adenosylcobinamide kinase/adenosylcobinamide-phosphate guanylyltransferase [Synergistaceae bacterium]